MPRLQDIVIGVSVTDNATGALRNVAGGIGDLEGASDGATSSVRALGIGLAALGTAAVAAGGAVAGMTASFAAMGTEMARFSRSTGVGVRQLSGLEYAFRRTGLGTTDLRDALNEVNIKLIDARDDVAHARSAFDELGLSWQELRRVSPDVAFTQIISSLQSLGDVSIRGNIADRIFGDHLAQRILAVRGSFQDLADEANRLGAALDAESAEAAERFTDNLSRIGGAIEGVRNTVGTIAVGILNPLLEEFQRSLGILPNEVRAAANDVTTEFGNKETELYDAGKSAAEQLSAGFNDNVTIDPIVITVGGGTGGGGVPGGGVTGGGGAAPSFAVTPDGNVVALPTLSDVLPSVEEAPTTIFGGNRSFGINDPLTSERFPLEPEVDPIIAAALNPPDYDRVIRADTWFDTLQTWQNLPEDVMNAIIESRLPPEYTGLGGGGGRERQAGGGAPPRQPYDPLGGPSLDDLYGPGGLGVFLNQFEGTGFGDLGELDDDDDRPPSAGPDLALQALQRAGVLAGRIDELTEKADAYFALSAQAAQSGYDQLAQDYAYYGQQALTRLGEELERDRQARERQREQETRAYFSRQQTLAGRIENLGKRSRRFGELADEAGERGLTELQEDFEYYAKQARNSLRDQQQRGAGRGTSLRVDPFQQRYGSVTLFFQPQIQGVTNTTEIRHEIISSIEANKAILRELLTPQGAC